MRRLPHRGAVHGPESSRPACRKRERTALILVGWGLAQYPNLVTPDVTVSNAAAPEFTLRLLVIALGFGAILLLPSLGYLFYIFKGRERR